MTNDDVSFLPETNLWELHETLATTSGAACGRERNFRWTDSRHPVWGRSVYAISVEGSDKETLEAIAGRMRELGCMANTGPAAGCPGAEQALAAAGFPKIREAAGMIVEASAFLRAELPPDVLYEEPSHAKAILDWAGVVCRNLFEKHGDEDAVGFQDVGTALLGSGKVSLFLARDGNGVPLSVSASFIGVDGTGGVYYVGTEPTARRRGLGAALTSAATACCFARGCARVILQATALGKPVYEKLGYRTVSTLGRYASPPLV